MTIRTAAAALVLLSLAACGDQGRVVGTERRTAVVVAINRPKHFGITVRDATGHVQKISVSKHCNGWQSRTRIGMKLTIHYDRLVYEDGRRALRVSKRGLKRTLCG